VPARIIKTREDALAEMRLAAKGENS
jgi:hypothetical protein